MSALSIAFILFAMINFLVGTTLGMLMALHPAWWGTMGDVHAVVNRFGWLTMMIYGMTYAVLATSAGLRPPRAWPGWLQLAVAEAGVILQIIGVLGDGLGLWRAGVVLQAVAPTLFLYNILSAVRAGRRARAAGENPLMPSARVAYLARAEHWTATDRIGQRGTDLALMLWILAAWWMAVNALRHPVMGEPPYIAVLVDDGWLVGTVLAVAMHLHGRLMGCRVPPAAYRAVQFLWFLGLVLAVAGRAPDAHRPWGQIAGDRILGAAILGMALTVLVTTMLGRSDTLPAAPRRLAGRMGWLLGWAFAAVLGIALLAGADPLQLPARHLLFLGWITLLVYGVAHSVFPDLLAVGEPCVGCAVTQVGCAAGGALLMVLAFTMQLHGGDTAGLFAAGGLLSWLAFTWFVGFWLPRLLRRPQRLIIPEGER